MLIDLVYPATVGEKASLKEVMTTIEYGASPIDDENAHLLDALPPRLKKAQCFLDKMTGHWRYEFGEPLRIKNTEQLIFGTHMWPSVQNLRRSLSCCLKRLPLSKQQSYLHRLDEPNKHLEVLSEMIPVLNLNAEIVVDFEVHGRGQGNHTLDWLIKDIGGRDILFDVKCRKIDLIQQMSQLAANCEPIEPSHDPMLIFRGLDKKFNPSNPMEQLQGAWITNYIRQEVSELKAAFSKLDSAKLHFAILGDWETGCYILVQNESDRSLLATLFGIEENSRLIFNRS